MDRLKRSALGAQSAPETGKLPKASEGASQPVYLISNVEGSEFYIDGQLLVRGRRVRVLFDRNKSYDIQVRHEDFGVVKSAFAQPPYSDTSRWEFFFTVGERLGGVGQVVNSPGNSIGTGGNAPPAERTYRPSISEGKVFQPLVSQDAIAVVIGNRDYARDTHDVEYALNDANSMRAYLVEVRGYRPENIIFAKDATLSELRRIFGQGGRLQSRVRAGSSEVFVYYSGHGVPGLAGDRNSYLLPVDADPAAPQLTAYNLEDLYKSLRALPVKRVVVALEACFSGASDSGSLLKMSSGMQIEPRPVEAAGITVLSAAANNEIASWDKISRLGIFTKAFLDGAYGAADGTGGGAKDKVVTLSELEAFVGRRTDEDARRLHERRQSVSIQASGELDLASFR